MIMKKNNKKSDFGILITERGLEGINRFYGIYRGLVIRNDDPDNCNNLYVWVPEVLGGLRAWAYPRNQRGGVNHGYKQLTPRINEVVWITFEYGDASKPLWEYHGWAPEEAPESLAKPSAGGFITPNGNCFLYDEEDNSLFIDFKGPVFINSDSPIEIVSSKVVGLTGNDGTVINEGDNGGMVNINQLTEKLNNLVKELEQIKTLINTHTHNCTTPGSPSGPPITPIIQPITPFKAIDYEDNKALH